jgi:hypothetical protein
MPQDVREKLWNFAYDLLEEREQLALRAEISSDPQLAREYSRVMCEIHLVRQAAKSTNYTLDFVPPEDYVNLPPQPANTTKEHRWRFAGKLLLTFLAAGLAVALVTVMSMTYWSPDSPVRPAAVRETWETLAREFPRMLVTGPAELHPGIAASYQVIVLRMDGQPITTRLAASLKDHQGILVWRAFGNTDSGGDWRFQLPADLLPGHYQLLVDTPELGPRMLPAELQLPRACFTWLTVKAAPESYWNTSFQFANHDLGVKLNRRILLKQEPLAETTSAAEPMTTPAASSPAPDSSTSDLNLPVLATVEVTPPPQQTPVAATGQQPSLEMLREEQRLRKSREKHLNKTVQKATRANRWFVEGLSYENGLLSNRFLLPAVSLKEELETLQRNASEQGQAFHFQSAALFDYVSAPPQSLAPLTQPQTPPLLGRLELAAQFAQPAYRAGELVELEVQVTNESAEAQPAILGVAVESAAEPASPEMDNLNETVPGRFTTAGQPALEQPPLVFDNGTEQMRNLERAFSTWRGERNARRQYIALSLLFGSGIGYALILFGSLLKLLPKPWVWLPIVSILFASFTVGALWIPLSDPLGPPIELAALMNYGIHTDPPFETETLALRPSHELEELSAETPTHDTAEHPTETSPSALPIVSPQVLNFTQGYELPLLPELDAVALASTETNTEAVLLPPMQFWISASRQRNNSPTSAQNEPNIAISSTLDIDINRITNNAWRSYIAPPSGKPTQLSHDEASFFSNAEVTMAELEQWSAPATSPQGTEEQKQDFQPLAQTGVQYWHPQIKTNPNGRVLLQFMAPPQAKSVVVRIHAHQADHVGVLQVVVPLASTDSKQP